MFFGENTITCYHWQLLALPSTPPPPKRILTDGLKNWPGVDFVIIIALHNEHPEEVFTEINRKTLTMVVCCGFADEWTDSARGSLQYARLSRARLSVAVPRSHRRGGESERLFYRKLNFVDEKFRLAAAPSHISPFVWKLQLLSRLNSCSSVSLHHWIPPGAELSAQQVTDKTDVILP